MLIKSILKILFFAVLPVAFLRWIAGRFHDTLVGIYPPAGVDGSGALAITTKVLETGVWLAVTLILVAIISHFLSSGFMRQRLGREIPGLLRDLIRYSVFLLCAALILNSIWGNVVTPLLGALGIGGIVLGFALQETLSNFFAGLSLLAEQPFSHGDWIRIGDGLEGRVEKITWRAVRLYTRDRDYLIFPNSLVAKETINNFHQPTRLHAARVMVGAGYDDPPDKVKRVLLQVAASVSKALPDPPPAAGIKTFGDSAIVYVLRVFTDDFESKGQIEDELMHRIWYAFRREGISIPYPIRTVHNVPSAPAEDPDRIQEKLAGILAKIEIFSALSDDERRVLLDRSRLLTFTAREHVIRQNEPGDALYAIVSGRVSVLLRSPEGEHKTLATLGPGDIFGEMSLLTGEPRKATVVTEEPTVVCEIAKLALLPVLQGHPGLAEHMAGVMAKREKELEQARTSRSDAGGSQSKDRVYDQILSRVKKFFGLR